MDLTNLDLRRRLLVLTAQSPVFPRLKRNSYEPPLSASGHSTREGCGA